MAKALGLTPQEEHLPNLSTLTPHLAGNVGLLFSSQTPDSVLSYFSAYTQTDFARAGVSATRDVVIPEGTVYSTGGEVPADEDVPLPHSLEPTLRKWGMPTRLVRGKVTLDGDWTLCREGQVLNSHQTALLKSFGIAMAEFSVRVIAYYDSAKEAVEVVEADEE